jgi:Co/Zn/Cd efflux system component
MLKSITQWLAMNAFFITLLLIFAGLIYGFLSLQKWLTEGTPTEFQAFTVPVFGLAAVGVTIWLIFKFHAWINRRLP